MMPSAINMMIQLRFLCLLAAFFIVASSALPQILKPPNLGGTRWKFNDGWANITGAIVFRNDGTYTYDVKKGPLWRITHSGRYTLRLSRRPIERGELILSLKPDSVRSTADLEGKEMLHQLRMPIDDTPIDYRVYPGARDGATQLILHHTDFGVSATAWYLTEDEPAFRP